MNIDMYNPAPKKFQDEIVGCSETLKRLAIKLCHNVTRAEDLTQTTIVKALASWQQFQPGTNLRAWLFVIMRNQYYSDIHRDKRHVEDPDDFLANRLADDPRQDSGLFMDEIYAAIAQLSSHHQSFIHMAAAGYSMQQMAEAANVSEGTARSRLSRARSKLAAILHQAGYDVGEKWGAVAEKVGPPKTAFYLSSRKIRAAIASPQLPDPLPHVLMASSSPDALPTIGFVTAAEEIILPTHATLVTPEEKVEKEPMMPTKKTKTYDHNGILLATYPFVNKIAEIRDACVALDVLTTHDLADALCEIDPDTRPDSMRVYVSHFVNNNMTVRGRVPQRLPVLVARLAKIDPEEGFRNVLTSMSKDKRAYWLDVFAHSKLENAVPQEAPPPSPPSSIKSNDSVLAAPDLPKADFQGYIFLMQKALSTMALATLQLDDTSSAFTIAAEALTELPENAKRWWAEAMKNVTGKALPSPELIAVGEPMPLAGAREKPVAAHRPNGTAGVLKGSGMAAG